MRLTDELLARYVGGQMEIQNEIERYLLRGEVASAENRGGILKVRFAWLAKGVGQPLPSRWVNEGNLDYNLELMEGFTNIADIGPGSEGGSRISIQSVISIDKCYNIANI
ncbi:MAG: hypothetical protein AAB638_01655 [Patescibacteria group bacterium]